ncbi:response regulator transcription factor [Actinosynnema sp. NPDC047251]|uniref:Transcriptional regulator, LuxR family n=1 Tax=Saccharothrix espanaensis (strain ATCC 51144 / DSM 44229 / JCM 9112 / NBRC 15066 / NRRL 15764) TaxID=1179773 RepID=K0K290_SACES|nr:response regulator transcription factor [Saccharothrix espanaensis]CCH30984.1 Transcriptional regulator, LuxR family [Saccharothrix espanaensis DSM 44229]
MTGEGAGVIGVLIADDQAAVRSALRLVLDAEPDIEVLAEAEDGAQAVRLARERRPAVAVVDLRMPRLDGVAAIRELVGLPEPPTVVALTTFDLDEYLFGALRAGAAGFLLKDSGPVLLLAAVRAAERGRGLLDPQVTRRVISRFATPDPRPATAGLDRLTAREREVLRHVAEGRSNAEIARELWIEEGTVKTHVARVLAKLGLRTRVHAVIYAYEHGFTRREPGLDYHRRR